MCVWLVVVCVVACVGVPGEQDRRPLLSERVDVVVGCCVCVVVQKQFDSTAAEIELTCCTNDNMHVGCRCCCCCCVCVCAHVCVLIMAKKQVQGKKQPWK